MKIIFTRFISALFAGVAHVHVHGQELALRSDVVVDYRKDVTGGVRFNKFLKGGIISDVPGVKFQVFDTTVEIRSRLSARRRFATIIQGFGSF